jgi:hypothetical protein
MQYPADKYHPTIGFDAESWDTLQNIGDQLRGFTVELTLESGETFYSESSTTRRLPEPSSASIAERTRIQSRPSSLRESRFSNPRA